MTRTARDLYLDLLGRVVTNEIYGDPSIFHVNAGPYSPSLREQGLDWPAVAHTMSGARRVTNPDAAFIQLCADHIRNKAVVDAKAGWLPKDGPEWQAYFATADAITDAQPQTLAGVAAKARAARVEAENPDESVE